MTETSQDRVKSQNYYADPSNLVYVRRQPSYCGHFWEFELRTVSEGISFTVYTSRTLDGALAMGRAYGLTVALLN